LTAPDSTLAVCLFLLASHPTIPYLKHQDLEKTGLNKCNPIGFETTK
jgi:hypothetical protein